MIKITNGELGEAHVAARRYASILRSLKEMLNEVLSAIKDVCITTYLWTSNKHLH